MKVFLYLVSLFSLLFPLFSFSESPEKNSKVISPEILQKLIKNQDRADEFANQFIKVNDQGQSLADYCWEKNEFQAYFQLTKGWHKAKSKNLDEIKDINKAKKQFRYITINILSQNVIAEGTLNLGKLILSFFEKYPIEGEWINSKIEKLKILLSRLKNLPKTSSHELYQLNMGAGEGAFHNQIGLTVKIYSKPSLKSSIVGSVLIKESQHPADFYKEFDDGTGLHYFLGIYSKERKGDFFKVYYKGSYSWIHLKQIYRPQRIEQYFSNRLTFIPLTMKLFDAVEGKLIKIPKVKKQNGGYEVKKLYADVIDFKWRDNKLWLKVKIHKEGCNDYTYFEKPVEVWIHPWNEKGKPLYSYPYKGC